MLNCNFFLQVIEGVQNYARGCQPEAEPLVKATGYSQKGCLDTKTDTVRKYKLLIFIHVKSFIHEDGNVV